MVRCEAVDSRRFTRFQSIRLNAVQKMTEPNISTTSEAQNLNINSAQWIADYNQQYSRIMKVLMDAPPSTDVAKFSIRLGTLFAKAAIGNLANPENLFQLQMNMLAKNASLGEYVVKKLQGQDAKPVIEPKTGDFRFKASDWHSEPTRDSESGANTDLWFDAIKQSYLIGSEYFQGFFNQANGLTSQENKKLKFFTEQMVDAMAPTNLPGFNPQVIDATRESKGENLINGMRNLADDLEAGRGVKMVERDAFELGRNIATTPGKVVARNRMAELIQYSPSTDEVHTIPIMIVPPWINKYYILDLSARNSFIGWLVGQGFTVFVISWVNPDESYRDVSFDDYLQDGPLWAMDVIHAITEQNRINAIGYCLGGTLLATLLGYLANQQEREVQISSATFFTTMIDFTEPGDLGVFVDEDGVAELEQQMESDGYLDGKSMASTFSMMRSNDLIWHFVINNYLLGKSPGQFDLLYWNSDSTRLPARMHSYYLRSMYLDNLLAQPDGIQVLGTPIDLTKVAIPTIFVSTELDHIAPWQSTYSGARLFAKQARFILGQSGHIAGIINPPTRTKYGYWTRTRGLPISPDKWLESATYTEGSWWPEWEKWIKRFSGKRIEALEPGGESYPPLAQAPGTYVNL